MKAVWSCVHVCPQYSPLNLHAMLLSSSLHLLDSIPNRNRFMSATHPRLKYTDCAINANISSFVQLLRFSMLRKCLQSKFSSNTQSATCFCGNAMGNACACILSPDHGKVCPKSLYTESILLPHRKHSSPKMTSSFFILPGSSFSSAWQQVFHLPCRPFSHVWFSVSNWVPTSFTLYFILLTTACTM